MESKWIPVSDRLPAEGVRCIVVTRVPGRYVIDGEPRDGHEIEFGEWIGDRWKCFEIACVSIMHPSMVSHWMPLPMPPATYLGTGRATRGKVENPRRSSPGLGQS